MCALRRGRARPGVSARGRGLRRPRTGQASLSVHGAISIPMDRFPELFGKKKKKQLKIFDTFCIFSVRAVCGCRGRAGCGPAPSHAHTPPALPDPSQLVRAGGTEFRKSSWEEFSVYCYHIGNLRFHFGVLLFFICFLSS